jgi:hypothetical protein
MIPEVVEYLDPYHFRMCPYHRPRPKHDSLRTACACIEHRAFQPQLHSFVFNAVIEQRFRLIDLRFFVESVASWLCIVRKVVIRVQSIPALRVDPDPFSLSRNKAARAGGAAAEADRVGVGSGSAELPGVHG